MHSTIAPTHDQIAARAFERFSERGGEHGHDLDDWLEAERELREPRLLMLADDERAPARGVEPDHAFRNEETRDRPVSRRMSAASRP